METYSVKAILSAVDSNFTSTMSKANSSLSGIKSASEGATSSIMKIASGIGVFKALNAGASLLKGSISSAFGRQDTMEAFNRTITQITGSTENAKSALEELKGITKGTAYGLDVAAKATQNFVTRGMDLKEATKSVGIWADAVAFYGKGTNEQLETVTDALAKMRTKGTVEMEQMNRLFDVGINATGMYAKATGKDVSVVKEALSEGEISTEEFLNVVEKAMSEGADGVQCIAGAAKEAGASWSGTIDNMKAAVTRGTLSVINAIDNMLSKNKLPQMREMISKFGQAVETTMGGVAKYIEGFDLKGMAPQLAALAAGLVTLAGSSDYLKILGTGFDGLTRKTKVFGNIMSSLPNKAKSGIDGIIKGFNNAGGSMGKSLKQIAEENNTTVNELRSKAAKIAQAYKEQGMDMSSAMKKAYQDIGYVATSKSNEVGIQLKGLSDKFVNLVPSSVKNKVSSTLDSIKSISSSTSQFIGNSFSKVSDKIPEKFKNTGSKIGDGLGKGMKKGTDIGLKSLSTMSTAMTKVFSIALKSVGPVAILGLAVAGLGLINSQFGGEIDQMISLVTTKGPEIINKLVVGIVSNVPKLAKSGTQIISNLADAIVTMLPIVVSAGLNIINSLVQGVTDNIDSLVSSGLQIIGAIGSAILTALPQLMLIGLQILSSITNGIITNLPLIMTGIQMMTSQIQETIRNSLPAMIAMGIQILTNIATGIAQMLPQLAISAIEIITTLVSTIGSNLPQILDSAVNIINTLVDGILNNLPQIIDTIVELIGTIVETIISNLPLILSTGVQIIIKLAAGLIRAIPQVIGAVGKVAKRIITAFKETNWLSIGINVIKGIAKGITGAAGQLWDAAKKALGSFKDKVLGFFGIHSPSRWGKWVGRMLDTGVAKGISGYARLIGNQAQNMFDTVSSYVSDISNLGMQYSFAGDMGAVDINHYVDINDDYISSNGGDSNNNEYYFNITNEIDGKEVSKATYKYDQQNAKKDEKFLKKLRGEN